MKRLKRSNFQRIIDSADKLSVNNLTEVAQKYDLSPESLKLMISIILHNNAEKWTNEQIFSILRGEALNTELYSKAAEEVIHLNALESKNSSASPVKDSNSEFNITPEQKERVDKLFDLFFQGKLVYHGKQVTKEDDAQALIGLALQSMRNSGSTKEIDETIKSMENSEEQKTEDSLKDTWKDIANSVKEKISSQAVSKYKLQKTKTTKKEGPSYAKRAFKSFWNGLSPMLSQIFGPISTLPEDIVNWVSKEYQKIKTKEKDLVREGNDILNKKRSKWVDLVRFNDNRVEKLTTPVKGKLVLSWKKGTGYSIGYSDGCDAWIVIDPDQVIFKPFEYNLSHQQYLFKSGSNFFIKLGDEVEEEKDLYYLELPLEPKVKDMQLPSQKLSWSTGPIPKNFSTGTALCFGDDVFILNLSSASDIERDNVSYWTIFSYGKDSSNQGTPQEVTWDYSFDYQNEAPAWLATNLTKDQEKMEFFIGTTEMFDPNKYQIVIPLDYSGKLNVDKDPGVKVSFTWYNNSERIPDAQDIILVKSKSDKFYVDTAHNFYDKLRGCFIATSSGRKRVKSDSIAYWCFLPSSNAIHPKVSSRGQKLEMVFHDVDNVPPPIIEEPILVLQEDDSWDVVISETVSMSNIKIKKWCYLNV